MILFDAWPWSTARVSDGPAASAFVRAAANQPPSGGAVAVRPTNGTALSTVFTAVATGWSDLDGHAPLLYRFTAKPKGKGGAG